MCELLLDIQLPIIIHICITKILIDYQKLLQSFKIFLTLSSQFMILGMRQSYALGLVFKTKISVLW